METTSQKAFSLAEIKWTDKFFEDPSRLKSLRKFLALNDGIRKIIVTTKSKLGSSTIDGSTFLFIPSALYAYWVSKYLFEKENGSDSSSGEQCIISMKKSLILTFYRKLLNIILVRM